MRLFSRKKTENVNAISTDTAPLLHIGETTDEALQATMHKPLEEWLVKTSDDYTLDISEQFVQPTVQSFQPFPPNPPAVSALIQKSQKTKNVASNYYSDLGKFITILLRSSELKAANLAQIEQAIIPAIKSGQFIIAETRQENRHLGMPAGVVTWANVSEDVNRRLVSNIDQPLQLNADEWQSGDISWLVFAAGEHETITNIIEELVTKMCRGRALRMRQVDEVGKAFVDEIEASKFENRQPKAAVGRNNPCPCGSGKRYKHCHGVLS